MAKTTKKTAPTTYVGFPPVGLEGINISEVFGVDQGDRDVWARNITASSRMRGRSLAAEDLEKAITGLKLSDTIRGSSTCELAIVDEDWKLLDSGFFDCDRNGKLDPIDVNYPDGSELWWRATQIGVDGKRGFANVTLTFLERSAVWLMSHTGPYKISRAKRTRAEFFRDRVHEVKAGGGLHFHSKQLHVKQKIASMTPTEVRARERKLASDAKDRKRNKDKGINVKSGPRIGLNAHQIARANTCLDTADRMNASDKVMVAMMCAALQESQLGENLGSRGTTFQTTQIPESELGLQAHYWLKGGKGFLAGGGIAYARDNPGASPGNIAVAVEGPGEHSVWDHTYNAWKDQARKIVDAYGGSDGGAGGAAVVKSDYTEETWAAALLAWLEIGQKPVNMQAMVGWERAEGGHWHNDAKYNPLNTTQNMPGSGDTGTQGNISVFTSWKQGLDATAKTFTHKGHGYDKILAALRTGTLDDIAKAVTDSDWAPGQYTSMLAIMQAAPSNLQGIDGGTPSGGGASSPGGGEYTQQYNFEIGTLDKPRETYWDGLNRLADEVNWPFFVDGFEVYFDPENELIKQVPAAVIERDDPAVVSFNLNWDARQIATEATLVLLCNPFEFRAGDVFELENFGPASVGSTAKPPLPGRWLVDSWDRDRFELHTTFTLKQPEKPKPEPRSPIVDRTDDAKSKGGTKGEGKGGVGTVDLGGVKVYRPIDAKGVYGRSWHETTKGVTGITNTSGHAHWHSGLDYAVPAGTPCIAPVEGVITMADSVWSDGGMVHFKFTASVGTISAGMIIGWGHCKNIRVHKGQRVHAGQRLADSGNPGGGPHVHFVVLSSETGGGDGTQDPTAILHALQEGGSLPGPSGKNIPSLS